MVLPSSPPNSAPFFIVGSERSGSNLLRLILNAHSRIAIPHPPHILKYFTPLLPGYGELAQPRRLRRLIDDVLALLRVHIYPWEMELDPLAVIREIREPSLLGVYFAVYNLYLAATGKRRWGCKSTFMIHHLNEILAACPAAKFLFLVRDPRDVAVSSRQSVFSPFHPYFTARLWQRQQEEGLTYLDGPQGANFFLIRYEELIQEPERTVRGICEFLHEPYEPAMLEFHQTPAARKSQGLSTSWHNTASPVQAGNMNRFKEGLTPEETGIVEGLCGELMHRFGYELTAPPPGARSPSPLTLCRYYLLDRFWFLRVEWESLRRDRNYGLRQRRRLLLWWLGIKSRIRCLLPGLGS